MASGIGFESAELTAALGAALAGRPAALERALAVRGAVVTARPNLKLAAAFGHEVGALPGQVGPLLARLGGEDAAPDTDRAFLPIAAAFGWAARIRNEREIGTAWAALGELAADERAPVRLGTRAALIALAQREGGGDELVERAQAWLDDESLERRLGSAALVMEVLADRAVVQGVRAPEPLRRYFEAVLDVLGGAPRSAERLDARRRVLAGLPAALATHIATGAAAVAWFGGLCAAAEDPAVRAALSDAVIALRAPRFGLPVATADELRVVLEGSAKPLRHADRVRPGTGRGKASRRTR